MTAGPEPRIVVGVDGSDSSLAALRWSMREAKLRGGRVEAVIAWHFPATYWQPEGIDVDFEGSAHQVITAALAAVDGLAPGVPVLPVVAEGYPPDVLLRTAKGADLLVVGRRGHSGFTSALIGSVSLHCVLHAHCPVLVLREERGES